MQKISNNNENSKKKFKILRFIIVYLNLNSLGS